MDDAKYRQNKTKLSFVLDVHNCIIGQLIQNGQYLHSLSILENFGKIFFQTEAERRRREAGVQQSMENGLGSCLYVWFSQISGDLQHRASPKWYHTMAT